jgi:hypothetical protein
MMIRKLILLANQGKESSLFVPFSNRIYPCNDKQEMDKDEI